MSPTATRPRRVGPAGHAAPDAIDSREHARVADHCTRGRAPRPGTPTSTPCCDAGLGAGVRPPRRRLPPRARGPREHPRAFRHAVDLGYRYLETDVHATSDGVLLAFHDAVLDRVTDRTGAIARLDAAPRCARRWIGGREQVPTLAELLRRRSRTPVQHRPQVRGRGAAAGRASSSERDAWDRVCVGSFSRRRLHAFRRLTARPGGDLGAPGRGGCVPVRCPAAGSPTGSPAGGSPPSRSRTGAAGCVVATRGLVRRAHAAGKHVHVWTVDDPAEMQRAARPWCRRPDHRPHRRTQGRARRTRPVEGARRVTTMTARRRHRRPRGRWTARKEQRPGTGTTGPTRAFTTTIAGVLFGPYLIAVAEKAARRQPDRRCSASSIAPGVAAVVPDHALHHPLRACSSRCSARSPTAPRARRTCSPGSPGPAPPSRRCCSSSPATTGSSARSPSSSPTSASAPPPCSTTRSCCLISDRGRARPGLLARLGVRLPRRRPAAGAQLRAGHAATTRSGSPRGWRSGSACCRPRSGGRGSRSSRSCGLRNHPPTHVGRRDRRRRPRRASGSCGRR